MRQKRVWKSKYYTMEGGKYHFRREGGGGYRFWADIETYCCMTAFETSVTGTTPGVSQTGERGFFTDSSD
jgi:hypothetical protein